MEQASHPAVKALSAALADAAGLLRVATEEVALERMTARDWPDSCLGAAEPGEVCADVVTPGYAIDLADGFHYHADQRGNIRRAMHGETPYPDTELHVRFTQSGGIGGWTSEWEAHSETLPPDDEVELRHLIEQADFFNVANALPPGGPIPDGFTFTLWIAIGRRNHTVTRYEGVDQGDSAALRELFAWVGARAPRPGPGRVG